MVAGVVKYQFKDNVFGRKRGILRFEAVTTKWRYSNEDYFI